jgi:hypothetical protein
MKTFKDCALVALSSLALLGMLEFGLRIYNVKFEASLYEPHPILYNVYRPDAEGWTTAEEENYVHMNSFGMRDRERILNSPTHPVRIAFLGDSLVAALQVPLDKTMTQTLERGLNSSRAANGHKVEVLNFAVGGYSLYQMYLMLEEKVWDFKPNMVAICLSGMTIPNSYRPIKSLDNIPFATFDAKGSLTPDPGNIGPLVNPNALHWKKKFADIYNQFRILQLARTAQQTRWGNLLTLKKAQLPMSTMPSGIAKAEFMRVWPYKSPETEELTKAWLISEAILEKIVESAARNNAELWLIQIGHEIEVDPRDSVRETFLKVNELTNFKYAEQRYAEFARRHNTHFLPISPQMLQYAKDHNQPLHGFSNTKPYSGHWNIAGNAAAAKIIHNAMVKESSVLH